IGNDKAGVSENDKVDAESVARMIEDRLAEFDGERAARPDGHKFAGEIRWIKGIDWTAERAGNLSRRLAQRSRGIGKARSETSSGRVGDDRVRILSAGEGGEEKAGHRQRR